MTPIEALEQLRIEIIEKHGEGSELLLKIDLLEVDLDFANQAAMCIKEGKLEMIEVFRITFEAKKKGMIAARRMKRFKDGGVNMDSTKCKTEK